MAVVEKTRDVSVGERKLDDMLVLERHRIEAAPKRGVPTAEGTTAPWCCCHSRAVTQQMQSK